jgi:hypothetical protein
VPPVAHHLCLTWCPGDEVYVYAYTGTWTADWPHNHFTQFLGILLRPDSNLWDGPPRRREDTSDANSTI